MSPATISPGSLATMNYKSNNGFYSQKSAYGNNNDVNMHEDYSPGMPA